MSYNRVMLIGRLVRDVELKTVGDNVPLANFTLAVDKRFKPKNEDQPTSDFIPVVAWRSQAEFASKYFSKGRQVFVSGPLETRSWENEDGTKGYSFCINADEIGFADSANSGETKKQGSGKPKKGNPKSNPSADDGFIPMGNFQGDDLPF